MPLGYILAIIFGVVWLGFKLLEVMRTKKSKNAVNKVVKTEKTANSDINDLIL